MAIVPRAKLDRHVDKRYAKVYAQIWGEIEELLLANEAVAKRVEGFCNQMLDNASKMAAERAVRAGKNEVVISSSMVKMAAHLHNHLGPSMGKVIQLPTVKMMLEFVLTEAGYDVENDTFSYHHVVELPEPVPQSAEVVHPLQIEASPDSKSEEDATLEEEAAPEEEVRQPRRDKNWRRAEEETESTPPKTRPQAEAVAELQADKEYTNKKGLVRRVLALTDDGKVRYVVIVGSTKIPAGTEGEITVWSFVKWTKS